MKIIIKFVLYWLKARYGSLSIEEFCALCDEYEKLKHSAVAEHALKMYLASHTPHQKEIERIYKGKQDLQMLYLENIPHERSLTDFEQHMMVCHIPAGYHYHFPSALRQPALAELFEKGTPRLIATYVSDYVLTPEYELLLIDKCKEERPDVVNELNSYRHALWVYLSCTKGCKLNTPDVQLAILALGDDEITIALIKNCTLTNNILFMPVLKVLAEQGSLNVLQTLLLHSFIAFDDIAPRMLQRFPQLKFAYDISCLRRPLYKLERKVGKFWGTAAPTLMEFHFIEQVIADEAETDANERYKTTQKIILTLLKHDVTPYFCAWIAYKFPELSEQAYKKLRQIAKSYCQVCKAIIKKLEEPEFS